ncbi:MAG: rod shape-determining protein MreC [Clostridia bacterium]|nr:rod shape-determining protein MreC [Clostridia bacterium]
MRQFLKSTQFKIFVVVLAALFGGTVLAAVGASNTSPWTAAVGTVFAPLQKLAGRASEKVQWFTDGFASARYYQIENEELKEILAEYEHRLADYDEVKHKVASYEEMLGVKEANPDFELCPANIIGVDAADLFSSLIIDRGSGDDVQVNDPVVCGNYLVGVVKKVNPSYSVVQTLLNPSLNISAIESKTRETSYVTTTALLSENGQCMLAGLDRLTAIVPGGLVLTSGIGGIYPKGLIIGTVAQVLESEHDLTSYAVIQPGADIAGLEDVFVITGFSGQGVEQITD